MSELRFRPPAASLLEIGRTLVGLAQVELAEMRQRQNLSKKHNDMLDLLEDDFLGANELLMNYYLPANLPLGAVRYYIEQDRDYPSLQERLRDRPGQINGLDTNENRREGRRRSRIMFIDGAGQKPGDSRDTRWQIFFNLTVIGALKDAELLEYHRQDLDQVYTETKDKVNNHLPWSSRQLIFKDYPFIQPNKGWSPFAQI